VDTRLAPKISQLSGVGLVTISGGQKPAVRIQANPSALSSYGINLEDLRTAVTQSSVNAAKGNFDGDRQDYQIDANDQLVTSQDYRSVVVAYRNGAPVMLTDVAKIVDGIENKSQAAWMDKTPAVIVNVQRQPGGNTISVVNRSRRFSRNSKAISPRASTSPPSPTSPLPSRLPSPTSSSNLFLTIGLVVMVMFSLPAKPFGHHHPQRRRSSLSHRHFRCHVRRSATAYDKPLPDGPHHLDGIRRRRTHVMVETSPRYIEKKASSDASSIERRRTESASPSFPLPSP